MRASERERYVRYKFIAKGLKVGRGRKREKKRGRASETSK